MVEHNRKTSKTYIDPKKILELDPSELTQYENIFKSLDNDKSGFIDVKELHKGFKYMGYHDVKEEQIASLLESVDRNSDNQLAFNEFVALMIAFNKEGDDSDTRVKALKNKKGATVFREGEGGSYSQFSEEERSAFVRLINASLSLDKDCAKLLPINPDSMDLFAVLKNGVILCKLINCCVPGTIPEKQINKKDNMNIFLCSENLNRGLTGAKAIGVHVIGISNQTFLDQKYTLILGILWQLIKRIVLSEVSVNRVPELVKLLKDGENEDDLVKLSPEAILKRWFNYHLRKAKHPREFNHFHSDLKDGELYTILLNQLNPELCDKSALDEDDLHKRAAIVLQNANKLGAQTHIQPNDITSGNDKLNIMFTAAIYNTFNGLKDPEVKLVKYPQRVRLLNEGEKLADLDALSPEDFIKRWFNYHLENANHPNKVTNFSDDVKDSEKYTLLLNQLDPELIDKSALDEPETLKRAQLVLDQAKKLEVTGPATADDIANGEADRNLLFTENLYNSKHGLDDVDFHLKNLNRELPQRIRLLNEDEEVEQLDQLTPDDYLLRWFNYHLENANHPERVTNFGSDVKDSTKYTVLLNQLDPKLCNLDGINEPDLQVRAQKVLDNAHELGVVKNPLRAVDLTNGNEVLNREFVAALYHLHHGGLDDVEVKVLDVPQKVHLLEGSEQVEDLDNLSNDHFLKRWFNYHLRGARHEPLLDNFGKDLKDSTKYIVLLNQLDPYRSDRSALEETDPLKRAQRVLENARALGVNPSPIRAKDITNGNRGLNLLLTAAIYNRVNGLGDNGIQLNDYEEKNHLLEPNEDPTTLDNLPLDDFLKRWFNHHLKNAKHPNSLENFGDDLKDAEKYVHLLNQLSPENCDKTALDEPDTRKRAQTVLDNAKKLEVEPPLNSDDINNGNERLNKLFTAALYNKNHGLHPKLNDILKNKHAKNLLKDGETLDDLANLSPDDLLKRWFNYQLDNAGYDKKVDNFGDDLKDSEKFTVLLNELDPLQCDKSALEEPDHVKRAEKVLDDAKKLRAKPPVKPEHISSGNPQKNKLLVADLYNKNPNLEKSKHKRRIIDEHGNVRYEQESKLITRVTRSKADKKVIKKETEKLSLEDGSPISKETVEQLPNDRVRRVTNLFKDGQLAYTQTKEEPGDTVSDLNVDELLRDTNYEVNSKDRIEIEEHEREEVDRFVIERITKRNGFIIRRQVRAYLKVTDEDTEYVGPVKKKKFTAFENGKATSEVDFLEENELEYEPENQNQ